MRWVTQRVKSPGVPHAILRAPSPLSQYFMRLRAFIWPGVGMVGVSYCWLFLISLVGVVVWVQRVSDSLCAAAWFTSNPRIGWGKPRLVG